MFSIIVQGSRGVLHITSENMDCGLYVHECKEGTGGVCLTIDFRTCEVRKSSGEFYTKTLLGRSLRRGIRGEES